MQLDDIEITRNDGTAERMADHLGEVLLIVNTASKCGLTPQYEALERLQGRYGERGFRVLGFPSNDFGGQEPGSDEDIAAFCSLTFDVSFPLYAKAPVSGPDKQPLYAALVDALPEATGKPDSGFPARLRGLGYQPAGPGEVLWNFEKFLVGRDGEVVGRFAPDVAPDDDLIVTAIERELQTQDV